MVNFLNIDEGFNIRSQFGVSGTPGGILVDVDGTIASQAVAGAPAVFALASTSQEEPNQPLFP
jgi:hypothetical protein